jgi:hypothetical protein
MSTSRMVESLAFSRSTVSFRESFFASLASWREENLQYSRLPLARRKLFEEVLSYESPDSGGDSLPGDSRLGLLVNEEHFHCGSFRALFPYGISQSLQGRRHCGRDGPRGLALYQGNRAARTRYQEVDLKSLLVAELVNFAAPPRVGLGL